MQSVKTGYAKISRKGKTPLSIPVSMDLWIGFWGSLWVLVCAAFGASIQFWIPDIFWYQINLMSLIFNGLGSFTIAWITVLDQARFQYMQSYLVYDGLKMGFLSVMTTFGHVISDTDKLLHFGRWWPSPLNLLMTLVLAFGMYELGRFTALKYITGDDFSMDLMKMENEERRMAHELDMQFNQMEIDAETDALIDEHGRPNLGHHGLDVDADRDHDAAFLSDPHGTHAGDEDHLNADDHLLGRDDGMGLDGDDEPMIADLSTVDLPTASRHDQVGDPIVKVTERDLLDAQVKRMVEKRLANSSPWPQFKHIFILVVMLITILVCAIVAAYTTPTWFLGSHASEYFFFEFMISLSWSVAGAALGSYMNPTRGRPRYVVQWSTFRVNMLSCIFIGTAHNILLFRHYFPGSEDPRFVIVFARFITDFCGSLSSFAGLIDETATLFNSKCPTKVAIRNLSYNFFLCLAVFSLLVYIVGIALVFR